MERETLNKGFAEMFKNGVIMDVTTPEQAKIAEDAGACSVMALERVPSDIRKASEVARMSDPGMIEKIMQAVSIPVMAKTRIGHFMEARILEALGQLRLVIGQRGDDGVDARSTRARSSPRRMSMPTWTKPHFPCPLCAVPATWGRVCAGLTKGRQCCVPRGKPEPGMSSKPFVT